MNRYTLILTFLLSLISFPSLGMDFNDLVERDGLYYEKFTDTPFTGNVSGTEQGSLRKGMREGEWDRYNDNGQLEKKGTFKNGKLEGEMVGYHENGKIRNEHT